MRVENEKALSTGLVECANSRDDIICHRGILKRSLQTTDDANAILLGPLEKFCNLHFGISWRSQGLDESVFAFLNDAIPADIGEKTGLTDHRSAKHVVDRLVRW